MNYRREIDGLRALAVLPVIFFHAGFQTFGGGYVGVDVFFVISGYLITSIILSERRAGTFSLLNFYERRARRILPALFLVMATCIPLALWWLPPPDMREFAQSLIAVSAFVSNIAFWLESGYFGTAAEYKPLLHTWSLAIEEQFYLLFPAFLLITYWLGRKWVLWTLFAVAIASLLAAQWGSARMPEAAFFLLPARGWELLIGALLAFYAQNEQHQPKQRSLPPAWHNAAACLGLILITCSIFLYDSQTRFPGFTALVPTIGTALVILFATGKTIVGQALSFRPLVGIGLISYSAYLWHQPIFAFVRHRNPDGVEPYVFCLLAGFSMALAFLSWRFVERPTRDRQRFTRRQVFVGSLAGSLAFASFGLIVAGTTLHRDFYVNTILSENGKRAYRIIQHHTGGNIVAQMGDAGCNFWSRTPDEAFVGRFEKCADQHGQAIVILGDSHAMNIFNAYFRANVSPFIVGISRGGCRPHDARSYCHYGPFDTFLKGHKSAIGTLVFHQSGSYLLKDRNGKVDSALSFERGGSYEIHTQNIDAITAYLSSIAEYTKVFWLGPFPEARVDFRRIDQLEDGFFLNENSLAAFRNLDLHIKQRTRHASGKFRYVSLVDILNMDRDFLLIGDCLTFRDRDHFSVCGERIVGEKIMAAILAGTFE